MENSVKNEIKAPVVPDTLKVTNTSGFNIYQKVLVSKATAIPVLKTMLNFVISKLDVGNHEQLILCCKVLYFAYVFYTYFHDLACYNSHSGVEKQVFLL